MKYKFLNSHGWSVARSRWFRRSLTSSLRFWWSFCTFWKMLLDLDTWPLCTDMPLWCGWNWNQETHTVAFLKYQTWNHTPKIRKQAWGSPEIIVDIEVTEAMTFKIILLIVLPSSSCAKKKKKNCFSVVAVFVFSSMLPSTPVWGVYSETSIHHYTIPLTNLFTHLRVIKKLLIHPSLYH